MRWQRFDRLKQVDMKAWYLMESNPAGGTPQYQVVPGSSLTANIGRREYTKIAVLKISPTQRDEEGNVV